MGADLHDGLAAAGAAHLGEHSVDVGRLGRGLEGRHGARAEVVVDGAEQADAGVVLEEIFHQVRDGGLAVGAGDADHAQIAIRGVVAAAGRAGERGARIGDLDEGDLGRRGGGRGVRHDGDRAAAERLGDVHRAVGAQTGQGEEHVARHHATAVHHDAGDGTVERAAGRDNLAVGKQIGEGGSHGKNA